MQSKIPFLLKKKHTHTYTIIYKSTCDTCREKDGQLNTRLLTVEGNTRDALFIIILKLIFFPLTCFSFEIESFFILKKSLATFYSPENAD